MTALLSIFPAPENELMFKKVVVPPKTTFAT
jgi:hypothetical protein